MDFVTENKIKIIKLLKSINRDNTSDLLTYMDETGFYESPASTKYHLSIKGGLAIHSLSVLKVFNSLCSMCGAPLEKDSIIITSLLHDICKSGFYQGEEGNYSYRKGPEFNGHSKRSIGILNKIGYPINPIEENIIEYHMGLYGSSEFNSRTSEYKLKDLVEANNDNPLSFLFHYADMISSNIVEKEYDKK